jgi:hypothetical protein
LGLPTTLPSSAGSKLVVLVFEQDVERGERSVTARDILLQVELVRIAQFVARVHFLLKNPQIIPNHDDLMEECLERVWSGVRDALMDMRIRPSYKDRHLLLQALPPFPAFLK